MHRLLIYNTTILTEDESTQTYKVIPKGYLFLEDNYISQIGEGAAPSLLSEKATNVNGENLLIMPGLVNTHGHSAMSLLRSYADDLPLMKWLQEKIWPVEARLSEEEVYWGTLLSIVEMIRSGTTTFTDLYFFMEEAAKAVEESGIRAVLSEGLLGILESSDKALEYTKNLHENWHGAANGRISIILGPHALFTCPPDFMEQVLGISRERNMPIQIHLSETKEEFENAKKSNGKSPTRILADLGILDQSVIAAHCVHINEEDMDIIAEKNVGVAHNPGSNLKLGSGIAPVVDMLKKGIKVGIGTDGASSNNNLDMFEEMRLAALIPKGFYQDPTLIPAPKALEMATFLGAKVLSLDKVGKIKEGYHADLIGVNLDSPRMRPSHNLISSVVYSATGADVELVTVNGRLLMEKGKLLTLDEERITARSEELAKKLVGQA